MVRDNLDVIEKGIWETCEKAGRKRDEITLVAVSKNNPPEKIMEAYDEGVRHFGENRVQEMIGKMDLLPKDIKWHLIGHLQRNKVRYIVDRVYLIHSVDSLRLAEEISREAEKRGITVNVLIEVNVAGEISKYGTTAEDAVQLVTAAALLPGIRVKGLMTIAPLAENAEDNRSHFVKLKQLSVDIASKNIDNTSMDILSMGMTGDYAVAIEEGADMIRVGTGIFKSEGVQTWA